MGHPPNEPRKKQPPKPKVMPGRARPKEKNPLWLIHQTPEGRAKFKAMMEKRKNKGGNVEALRKLQEEADTAAVRAVEWFRDPSSNGGEIVTLLEDTNLWDHDQLDDPFGDATKWQRAKRRVERLSRRAVKKGTEVAGRVWDATSVKSTSSVVDR